MKTYYQFAVTNREMFPNPKSLEDLEMLRVNHKMLVQMFCWYLNFKIHKAISPRPKFYVMRVVETPEHTVKEKV